MKIAYLLFLFFLNSINVSSQTLDSILSKHYSAAKVKKLATVESIVINSYLIQGDNKFPTIIYHERPLNIRAEIDGPNGKSIQIFNGKKGWNINPKSEKALEMTETEAIKLSLEADFEGLLYNYKDRGHKVSLKGECEIDGQKAYELDMIKSTGDSLKLFLDANNYLLIRTITSNNIITDISDYREIKGIPFAFRYDSYGENFKLSQQIESIKLNSKIPPGIFIP